MPKLLAPKSARFVEDAKIGRHRVGGDAPGLILVVEASRAKLPDAEGEVPIGRRSWICRVMIAGKVRDVGIGGYPDVGLAEARSLTRKIRAQVRAGGDPIAEKKAQRAARLAAKAAPPKVWTFEACAEAYFALKMVRKDMKTQNGWHTKMKRYTLPAIGAKHVNDITIGDLTELLMKNDLWATKRPTAMGVRRGIEKVLAWAIGSGHRSGPNVAVWKNGLDALLDEVPVRATNYENLPWKEVPDFWQALAKIEGQGATALRFGILCASRPGEVRGALWSEIDLEAKEWRIPAARMKMREPHIVPLTDDAVAILEGQERLAGNDLIFPAARGGMLSDGTLAAVLRRMKVPAVAHGFRHTFSSWAHEHDHQHHAIEMSLAHAVGSEISQVYNKSTLIGQRRKVLGDWACFVHGR